MNREIIKQKILIAGDAMLDIYTSGHTERLSPDAPAPVFLEDGTVVYRPGGAANTAVNLAGAGMETILCAEIGDDPEGEQLCALLQQEGVDTTGILVKKDKVTARKQRYITTDGKMLMRADREEITEADKKALQERIARLLRDCTLLVISDYHKGFFSNQSLPEIISLAKEMNIPVLADVSGTDTQRYQGAFLIKPNRSALEKLSRMPAGTLAEASIAAQKLCAMVQCRYVLASLDRDGMFLFDQDHLICGSRSLAFSVIDTTGAGDTALAYFAACYAEGKPFEEALAAAARAAALQVEHPGTCTVHRKELSLKKKAEQNEPERENGMAFVESLREAGRTIVFTNGCFDILHAGHVQFLREAAKLGDTLIVGVNSDASVRRLKGETRPVNKLADRITVLAALASVDLVIPFEEDTPLRLIEMIRPDVLVKGADYKEDEIAGSAFVRSYGGLVKTLPLRKGHSTTGTIAKLNKEKKSER